MRGECSYNPKPEPKKIGMPNPAAVYCSNQGYDYQDGRCVFPDGSSCDAWAFMRGECSYDPKPEPKKIGMPNPASVYCVEHGGKLRIEETPAGQVGYCDFPDGSSCEEWAFMRGDCRPQPPPGRGGTEHFTFRAVGVGDTDLIMRYVAPDGSVAKEERYHISVIY
jgi:putative hemolysin